MTAWAWWRSGKLREGSAGLGWRGWHLATAHLQEGAKYRGVERPYWAFWWASLQLGPVTLRVTVPTFRTWRANNDPR